MEMRSYSNENVKILALSGRFDVTNASAVREWFDEAVEDAPPYLVVNLEAVDFMDSTGLSTLVHGMKRSREHDGDLHLCHLQQPVRIIFELTRLAQWFEIFMGEEEAVAAFFDNSSMAYLPGSRPIGLTFGRKTLSSALVLSLLLAKNRSQFENLGKGWLKSGATSFSVWENGVMLACWPKQLESQAAPELVAPINYGRMKIGELRVTGLGSSAALEMSAALNMSAAEIQLLSQSSFIAESIRLESELNSMAAELINTRDHLVALYDLIKASHNTIDVKETMLWLARESKRQVNTEGAFVLMKVHEPDELLQTYFPQPILEWDVIEEYLAELLRKDDPFLVRRGDYSEPDTGAFRGLVMVPMQIRGTTLAVLGLINKVGGDFMSPDIKLTQTIASYGAAQLENVLFYQARLDQTKLQAEMDLARRIQMQLLPERMPLTVGLDSWASSRPASRVGGDFYTAIEQSNQSFTFAVGDISGKGLPAAILMAMTRTILRSNTTSGTLIEPAGIIDISNRELYHDFSEVSMFATVFVGQYQPATRSLSYANAGHSPVVFVPAGREAQMLSADSTPMGIELRNEAVNKKLKIQGGDVLVVASDGLNEARNGQNEMFGYNRLLRLIESLAHKPAREISTELFRAVDEFSAGHSQDDDQTVVVLKGERA